METFRNNIPGHLTTLGIAANDPMIVQQGKDATYFRALLNVQSTMQGFGQAWTNWKNYERDGGAVAVPTPALPTLSEDFPEVVPPGIIPRYRACVKLVKARPTCTPAILEALGIDKQEETGPDLETVQPDIKLKIVGGQPFVDWGWGGYGRFLDQIELVVDRGAGEAFLAIDSTPGYLDTFQLPATPTKWTYRAIYRVGDRRVGVWSNPVTIIVGG
jgi:hypothetical protein